MYNIYININGIHFGLSINIKFLLVFVSGLTLGQFGPLALSTISPSPILSLGRKTKGPNKVVFSKRSATNKEEKKRREHETDE